MKKINIISLFIITIFVTSCNGTKKNTTTDPNEIYSGKYEIKSLNGAQLVHKLYFTIDASENKISGKTDCNTYSGNYTLSGKNDVTIGPLISTKMYCEEHVMKVESDIFKAFSNTKSFNFDNKMLTLLNTDGNVLIRAYKPSN